MLKQGRRDSVVKAAANICAAREQKQKIPKKGILKKPDVMVVETTNLEDHSTAS